MAQRFSPELTRLLKEGRKLARRVGQNYVDLLHLLLVMLDEESLRLRLFAGGEKPGQAEELKKQLTGLLGDLPSELEKGGNTSPLLEGILDHLQKEAGDSPVTVEDLIEIVRENWSRIFPVSEALVGLDPEKKPDSEDEGFLRRIFSEDYNLNRRYAEVQAHLSIDFSGVTDRMMEILIRRYRQNVLLYGHPGSGRSTALQQLVHRINNNEVPPVFRGRVLFQFHLELFVSNLENQSELVKRLALLREYLEVHQEIILVFEDLEMVMANLENELIQDLFNRLMHLVSNPRIHSIFITTTQFFNTAFNKNPLFKELFTPVYLRPLQLHEVKAVLSDSIPEMEERYQLKVDPAWLDLAVDFADRYIKKLHFPKKAVMLLDLALAKISVHGTSGPMDSLFRKAVEELTGEKFDSLEQKQERVLHLEEFLSHHIIGQPQAVKLVASHLRITRNQLDLGRERPDGVFLFVGPVGVGKRKMARLLSRQLYNREPLGLSPYDFVQVAAKNGDTTLGYQRRTLFDKLKESSNYLILLEDVEKIPAEVLEIFLNAADDGILQAPGGEKVHVSNTTIVFLMDIPELDKLKPLGFRDSTGSRNEVAELLQMFVEDTFSEEFRLQMDRVVPFYPLTPRDLKKIITRVFLPGFTANLQARGHRLKVRSSVVDYMVNSNNSPDFNARSVEKIFQQVIVNRTGDLIFAHPGEKFAMEFRMRNRSPQLDFQRLK